MTSDDGYESWNTEALRDQSDRLYAQYLEGDDVLDDLYEIAEVLRSRGLEP